MHGPPHPGLRLEMLEGLTDRARNAGQIESEGGMDMAAAIALPDFDSEPARERL